MVDTQKIKDLIDGLKSTCANYGLGNDGNEFKIITQVFLYKFLNDKFGYEIKKIDGKLKNSDNWEKEISKYSNDDYDMLCLQLGGQTATLKPQHFISTLFNQQSNADFGKLFDDTLIDISIENSEIYSVTTDGGSKERLFNRLTEFISDPSKRDNFARAIINKLVNYNFEEVFYEKYDFFATIFEYLIKDYNSDSGGKYAEYFTPHAVSKIMAAILVDKETQDVTVYDPSAGSGTLLMSVAHAIGEDKCTIYSQDISQKSSSLLRLNLILNNLVHSIQNIIQGNTLLHPYHRDKNTGGLKKFDFIVSNPPFKLDFSDYRDNLDQDINKERFFAGIANTPKKAKDKMEIYNLFVQHCIFSLSDKGQCAIVVPTGFVTAATGINPKIRKYLIDNNMLRGVVSMPSNIFATTGTNVSVLFFSNNKTSENVVLIDASKLGTKIKTGKNQKTVLNELEELRIVNTFKNKEVVEDFSVVVKNDEIKEKNYSFNAGQYFEIKIDYVNITQEEFNDKLNKFKNSLYKLTEEGKKLDNKIQTNFEDLIYE